MKNNGLRKKIGITLAAVVLVMTVFGAGAYAASTWMSFTGDDKVDKTTDNIDEIMDILRQVNEDKMTAEEALTKLEAMNPPGLVKKIKELERQLADKTGEVADKQKEIENKQREIDEKNRQIDEKDSVIDRLQSEKESADAYVKHLEEELERANTKVDGLNSKATNAVEEAREIVK